MSAENKFLYTDQSIQLPKAEELVFEKNLNHTRIAISSMAELAITNGADPKKLAHVENTVNPNAYFFLPPDELKRLLIEEHGEMDITPIAFLMRTTGNVVMTTGAALDPHAVLHESIHRSGWLRERELRANPKVTQGMKSIAAKRGLIITEDAKVSPDSEFLLYLYKNLEDRQHMSEISLLGIKEDATEADEGLTDWLSVKGIRFLLDTQSDFDIDERTKYPVYGAEVKKVDRLIVRLMGDYGFTFEQAEATMITAALTGDIKEIAEYY